MTADLTLEDGTGLEVLKDASDELKALASNFAGGSDPADGGFSIAYMLWLDTTNWLFKQRNADNDAWIVLGTVDQNTGKISWTNYNGLPITGGLMQGALFTPNPITIASVNGVVTLTNAGNSFVVTGSEAVISIAGWTAGIAIIRWNSDRTITYDATSLILQDAKNRFVSAGDISIFECTANGVRELNYFPSTVGSTKVSYPLGSGNYIADGLKFSGISGLILSVKSGTVVINNSPKDIQSDTLSLNPRKACLLYADSEGNISHADAQSPVDFIDNNTVGMWIFNQAAGTAVPNSAVGVSSLAVANDLTPTGGVISVDGWGDYASKLDGTSGKYVSSNSTNFPTGAAERELTVCFDLNSLPAGYGNICGFGVNSTNSVFFIAIDSSGQLCFDYSSYYGTGYYVDKNKKLAITFKYDGTKLYVLANGTPITMPTAFTLSTGASALYVGTFVTAGSFFSPITVDYVELRNKMRSDAKTAEISNKLLLPCFYSKNGAVTPTTPTDYASLYHEYLMSETVGTTVLDSNTANPLNGTATGTSIVDSEIGLTKARKLVGSGSNISVGNFACSSAFSYVGVVNITSYSQALWSNRPSGAGSGITLSINASGYITLQIAGTAYVLTGNPVKLGSSLFIAVSINGTVAKVFVDSPQSPVISTIASLSATANAAYIGYDPAGTYFTGTYQYCMFGNFEMTQAEISQYYTALMANGRRSIIDDVLPAGAVSLGYVRTSSSKIIEYNDADYKYGRREKAFGGNRRVFLGWKYFSGATDLSWDNPFGTGKYKAEYHYAQDAKGTNEVRCIHSNGYDAYGILPISTNAGNNDAQNITAHIYANGAYFNQSWKSSGYIGVYAEVLEDYKGVDVA